MFVVPPEFFRSLYVVSLRPLIPAPEQKHRCLTFFSKIDPISCAKVDSHFLDTFADSFAIAEIAEPHPVDSPFDALPSFPVSQVLQPLRKRFTPFIVTVYPDSSLPR